MYRLWLPVVLITFALSGCSTAITACPPPVYMDEPVAEELAEIPFEGFEDLYDFLAEIEVLNQQLDECQ